MISLLPRWALTNPQPAFLDGESGSVLEQTAKMYAKVNELITEYNSFTENINTQMKEFLDADAKAKEEHMTAIRQEFQDFIDVVNLKVLELETSMNTYQTDMTSWMATQEKIIADAKNYMVNNIENVSKETVNELVESGKLVIAMNYDEGIEELSLIAIPLDSDNSIVYTSTEEKIDII